MLEKEEDYLDNNVKKVVRHTVKKERNSLHTINRRKERRKEGLVTSCIGTVF
jgi:hypothetical protein